MNSPLRSELERLKERQAQLYHAVDLLGVHVTALEKRIEEEEAHKPADQGNAIPMEVPPLLADVANLSFELPTVEYQAAPAAANAPLLNSAVNYAPETARTTLHDSPPPLSDLPPVAFKTAPPSAEAPKPESFEMRLGTFWLVRIGIVAMLTALVFFASYAYQHYIGKIGAGGKIALLYLASGALLGFGAWFQRRAAKESLRNYAQVLLAGGMAAVYFTTYAAHYFPNLQVISSPTLDGLLLFVWAAFMAWTADRKKSEVFAMFSVGLAFYSSAITQVGYFTLYSNLVLAAAALFFLVRNQWAKLSCGCLIATYASYGFWRFYSNDGWAWAGPTANANLWTGVGFLAAYWLVFTAAVFLSRHKEFAGVSRASFITLNNAAFYVMFLLTMFQVRSGGFWKFNLITGAVLLGVAALAKVRLREDRLAANTYLTHGLLLVTIGIIAKFSEDRSTLALALCLESVVLWMLGTLRRNIIMRTGACMSAAMATLCALDGIERDSASGVWLGAGVGGLLAFNAVWAHLREQRNNPQLMRVSPTYFSALALFVWTFAISQNVAQANKPAAYAIGALVLVASMHLLRLRELSLLGQLLLPFAAFHFMANQTLAVLPEPAWVFACLAGVALALVHWWQKQTVIESPRELRLLGQFLPALILVCVTSAWLKPKLDVTEAVLLNSVLVLAMTAYSAAARNWVLALVVQAFAGIAVLKFVFHAGDADSLAWLPALAPLGMLTLLVIVGQRWASSASADSGAVAWVRRIAVWYGRTAMVLLVWWTFQYAASTELVWSFTGLGIVAFAIAGWKRSRDFLVFATVLNLCALSSLVFNLMSGTAIYWLNFVAVLVWMIEQQIARRKVERYQAPAMAHTLAMVGAGVALWWLMSAWVRQDFNKLYLTAGWSVFAFTLLGVGIVLRERIYRWLGLVVLGCALGRVVLFDVWRLDTIYRILSFFALGAVLLVLGFIYNKYQERLRQWL